MKKILISLDNSEHSLFSLRLASKLAKSIKATVVGCHVYAARLHNDRFKEMEATLPQRYRNEEELSRQREIHSTLITKGLKLISDSYMEPAAKLCASFDVEFTPVSREGKNYIEILKEAAENDYFLTVLGALGIGKVPSSTLGSVTERVL
ncbi:MAG: universal stress protein, partial [Deltaproteobacteria bacterium]|nr:universal stress protein [Deltaproteobacteria bacterium]